MNILEKIEKLELILPPAPKPMGIYKPTLIIENFLYVSGQGPVKSDGSLIIGKVGKDMDMHEAKKAARQVGLTMISSIVSTLTDNKVRCDVAMTGEITLKGKVLPIGGLNEKLLAAIQNGIKKVLIP